MTLPVFVVDTNVIVAGLITASLRSPVASIVDSMLAGSFVYLLSPALLGEYRTVLRRPGLSNLHGLAGAEVEQLLFSLTANAIWREPEVGGPAPDRGDDHLWALLGAWPGSILITGDRVLLEQPPQGASVITPRSWLERFAGNSAE